MTPDPLPLVTRSLADAILTTHDSRDEIGLFILWMSFLGSMLGDVSYMKDIFPQQQFIDEHVRVHENKFGHIFYTATETQINLNILVSRSQTPTRVLATFGAMDLMKQYPLHTFNAIPLSTHYVLAEDVEPPLMRRRFVPSPDHATQVLYDRRRRTVECMGVVQPILSAIHVDWDEIALQKPWTREVKPLENMTSLDPVDSLYYFVSRDGTMVTFRNKFIPLADPIPTPPPGVPRVHPQIDFVLDVLSSPSVESVVVIVRSTWIPMTIRILVSQLTSERLRIHNDVVNCVLQEQMEEEHTREVQVHSFCRQMSSSPLIDLVCHSLPRMAECARRRDEWTGEETCLVVCLCLLVFVIRSSKCTWLSRPKKTKSLKNTRGNKDKKKEKKKDGDAKNKDAKDEDAKDDDTNPYTMGRFEKERGESGNPEPQATLANRGTHQKLAKELGRYLGLPCELIGSGIFVNTSDLDVVVQVSNADTLAAAYQRVSKITKWQRHYDVIDEERVSVIHGMFRGVSVDLQVWRGKALTASERSTERALRLHRRLRRECDIFQRQAVVLLHEWSCASRTTGQRLGRFPGIAFTCTAVTLTSYDSQTVDPGDPRTLRRTLLTRLREALEAGVVDFDTLTVVKKKRATDRVCVLANGEDITKNVPCSTCRHVLDCLVFALSLEAVSLDPLVYNSWRQRTMWTATCLRPKSRGIRSLTNILSRLDDHPLLGSVFVQEDSDRGSTTLCILVTLRTEEALRYRFREGDVVDDPHPDRPYVYVIRGGHRWPLYTHASGEDLDASLSRQAYSHDLRNGTRTVPNAPTLTVDVNSYFPLKHWAPVV